MAPATASPTTSPGEAPAHEGGDLALRWSGQISLTRRILAVNIVALLMLAGGFFYLDSYRSRLVDARVEQARREARLMSEAIAVSTGEDRDRLIVRLARQTHSWLRVYGTDGRLLVDSGALGVANFALIDPRSEPRGQDVGRLIDGAIDAIVGAVRPPAYRSPVGVHVTGDVATANSDGGPPADAWLAPDRTFVITAGIRLPRGEGYLTTADNERDITWTVRAERFRLSMVLLTVTLVSVLLSLFLARTIVRPIRRLARAAVRVRLGRAREVVVPRLPSRRDEIGMLARALSDMSLALRARIDQTEAFAADVTHEIKNPLASLRSAVDGLGRVKEPTLQAKLLAIVQDDVRRLDRLITDISDASRLDAQLSRAKFERVDIAPLLAGLVGQREARAQSDGGLDGGPGGVRLVFDNPGDAALPVLGDGARLERVFENLIDNAVSFSPEGGVVGVGASREDGRLVVRIVDEGPGVPEEEREEVFRRFASIRPSGEAFGQHSGLGLAIARTIVEGHQGSIMIESREDRMSGAQFVVRLPLAGDA